MASKRHMEGAGRFLAPTLLLSSMIFVAILYVNAQYPRMIGQILGHDTLSRPQDDSISAARKREAMRLDKIDALLISPRNKEDLRQGQPFWGAAVHMVELAFQGPSDDAVIRRKGSRLFEFHRYGFSGNREPVVMEFQNNALSCVHYPQREQTACNPGVTSFYAGEPFPFNYTVSVGN